MMYKFSNNFSIDKGKPRKNVFFLRKCEKNRLCVHTIQIFLVYLQSKIT